MAGGERSQWYPVRAPHLDPWREYDAWGVGFVARVSGERPSAILRLALQALGRLAHRGAAAADSSGDGAGVLTQIPHALFRRHAATHGLALAPGRPFAVGAFFLPREARALERAVRIVEEVLTGQGLPLLAWRDVPVDLGVLGASARATCPTIRQAIITLPTDGDRRDEAALERSFYLARRTIERRVAGAPPPPPRFFLCSLACAPLARQ